MTNIYYIIDAVLLGDPRARCPVRVFSGTLFRRRKIPVTNAACIARIVADNLEPLAFEHTHGIRRLRVLLIERIPVTAADRLFLFCKPVCSVAFRPERFARCTSERIIFLRLAGQIDDLPVFAVFLCLFEDASGKVIFMPACHNEDDAPARGESGEQRCTVLVPDALADGLGLRLFSILYNIVNEEEVCAFAGDTAAEADGDHAACMSLDVPVRFTAV